MMDTFSYTGVGEFMSRRGHDMTRVLLIEDDPGMRESLRDLLALEELECEVAETGKKGLAMFLLHKPHLVVLDAQLPDVSGFQLCQQMKKDPELKRVPIVMVSGRFTEPQDRVQGLELGADDFFTKPFDPVLFVARIKNLLRASQKTNSTKVSARN
jgi:DNA-binding response OmpR family regulator